MSQYEHNEDIEFIRHVYRASSPTVTRQENRIKELEELLDLERETKARLERTNADLCIQLDEMSDQIQEFNISSSQYNEAIRKRDTDMQRLRKDLEKMSMQMELNEQENRKRTHSSVMELMSEIEGLQKQKQKQEKERMILMQEIESALAQLDTITKSKINAEAKLDNAEAQTVRFKALVEEQEKQIREISSMRVKICEENATIKIQIKEANHQNISLRKSKSGLDTQLEETKKLLEEETRVKELIQAQMHQIQCDNDQLRLKFEDESDNYHRLQNQVSRLTSELMLLKSKCDKDMCLKIEEFEELKRKSNSKINELQDDLARENLKTSSCEKARQKLAMELNDLYLDLERISTESDGLLRELKSSENQIKELNGHLHESETELAQSKANVAKVLSENSRLKSTLEDEEQKISFLNKEIAALASSLKEENDNNHSLQKELSEIHMTKNQLELENSNLIVALEEAKEMLVNAEHRNQSAHSTLMQLKLDMEQRLQEKDDELIVIKKNTQRTIEELSNSITDVENRCKTEMSKLKKKNEAHIREIQNELSESQKENLQLLEEMKETENKIHELEEIIEDERRDYSVMQEKLISSDKRKTQIQGDLDDSNRLLETSDKSRKKIQIEIEEISMKFADSISHVNIVSNEKRKLEVEISELHNDLDETSARKLDAEERTTKQSSEINRLIDELKLEQENHKKSETARKSQANELREIKLRLDERESSASKEIAKYSQIFQDRIRDLESELEAERTRSKDSQIQLRKQDRSIREIQQQAEEDRRAVIDLQQLLDGTHGKIKNYKRQIDELEMANNENLQKYKRAQKSVDEAEYRASIAERRAAGGATNHVLSKPCSITNLSNYSKQTGTR